MVKLQNIINLTLGSISPTSSSPKPTYSKELLKNLKDLAQSSASITDSEGRSYLDQLDPSAHTNTWISIFSAYFRWLVETKSDEIYSSLYLLKLSIPKFDIEQVSILPNLIGDLSTQLASLALNNTLTIEELPNQKLAILKLLLNLKTKLPNQSLLNPIHSNILKICLKTKAYHVGLKLIQERAYLDIDIKESPIQVQDYLTFHYYSALIHIGYKNYQSALENFMLVLIVPGKSISQVQIESVKKGVLIDLLTLKDQQDERFRKLIHKAINDNREYGALYSQFKSATNIDNWKADILKEKQLFENDNNWGLLQQVTNAYFPTKILALKEFKLLSFSQLGEYIGIRSVDEVESILVDLIQSGKLNAKISFNKQLGPSNGLVEFMNHKLPPNARERFNKLVGEIENTLGLNKTLQQAGITAAANLKRTSNFDSDPEVLSQFNSMLVD